MKTYDWYAQLSKPSWSPPGWVFGPVWTVLYGLIIISFGKVFIMAIRREIGWMVALPFIINLVSNFLYTPLQFGLKSQWLATADILVVLGSLIWAMVVIYPHARWISFMQIPYLMWVTLATVLQVTILYLNR